ncbi:dispersed gene family protein 1 (DGF-1), putative, partial [Trypanosoma cruzi marinkellei]
MRCTRVRAWLRREALCCVCRGARCTPRMGWCLAAGWRP